MGFGGISIECLLIVFYGLFPVFSSSGHAWRRFDTTRGTFWYKTFFFYLKANRLIQILQKNVGKKNVLFKNYNNLKSWLQFKKFITFLIF